MEGWRSMRVFLCDQMDCYVIPGSHTRDPGALVVQLRLHPSRSFHRESATCWILKSVVRSIRVAGGPSPVCLHCPA